MSLAAVRKAVATSIEGTSLRGIARGAERARPGRPHGQGVEAQRGRDAAARHRPLGGQPLGRPLRRRRQPRPHRRPRPRPAPAARADVRRAAGPATPPWSSPPRRSSRRPRRSAPGTGCGPCSGPTAGPRSRPLGLALGRQRPADGAARLHPGRRRPGAAERDVGLLDLLLLSMGGLVLVMSAGTLAQRYLLSRAAVRIDGVTLDLLTGQAAGPPPALLLRPAHGRHPAPADGDAPGPRVRRPERRRRA